MADLKQRLSWLAEETKHTVKRRLVTFRQGPRPSIAIFGIRRGGSTLLAEMIAEQSGVHLINEPYAVFPGHPRYAMRRRMLPDRPHSQFFDLDEDEASRLATYFGLLLRARLLGTCRRPKFPYRADRVVLKLLNVPALPDWLASRFPIQLVFLTRHPAAQALSVLHNGWGFSAEAYFERPHFLAQFFRGEQIEFGARVLAAGSDWEKAILNWVVENEVPLRRTTSPILRLTFEELNLRTDRLISLLCDRLALEAPERMREAAARPSSSTGLSPRAHLDLIARGDKEALLRSWQKKIDPAKAKQAQDILDRFDVSIYSMWSHLPSNDHLLCGPVGDPSNP